MLKSLGMELIPLATNFRELGDWFRDSHGAAVASSLLLFEDRYSTGLIASTEPYADLILPWGSNPLTDRLMSSGCLEIIHDGAAYTRCEKIEVIADWSEALKYLRVCWQNDNMDRNCCRCEKCIRTILNMRVLGVGLPECFEYDVSDRMILRMKGLNKVAINFLQEILDMARERSISESWVSALEKTISRNRRALGGWRKRIRDLRNRFAIRTRLKDFYSSGKEHTDSM